jgi:hypothetical protein
LRDHQFFFGWNYVRVQRRVVGRDPALTVYRPLVAGRVNPQATPFKPLASPPADEGSIFAEKPGRNSPAAERHLSLARLFKANGVKLAD